MRVALVVATLAVGILAAPPSPSPVGTKRSAETLQFGNQQNPPVGLLDDTALPGAFPSSEASDESQSDDSQPTQTADVTQPEVEVSPTATQVYERDLPPVPLASRWSFHGPHALSLYRPRYDEWSVGLPYLGDSFLTRRRRSIPVPAGILRPHRRNSPKVPLSVLRYGHRHKRDIGARTRFPRDVDIEEALRDADLVEVLGMLVRAQQRAGYPAARMPLSPNPPRFAPQPRLFPDYDDEDTVNMLSEDVPAQRYAPAGIKERVWRRSGYGLSSVPGFKRSAFRENNPPPQPSPGQDGDVYSLATMLGAEVDPVTHRFQHAAM